MACCQITASEQDFKGRVFTKSVLIFEDSYTKSIQLEIPNWLFSESVRGEFYVKMHLRLKYIVGYAWEYKFTDAPTGEAFEKIFAPK